MCHIARRLRVILDMTTATQAFTGTYTADPYHSSFLFAVQHMEVSSFRASFGDVQARLEGG
jgi:polyisoprenoid-binding protein YceI